MTTALRAVAVLIIVAAAIDPGLAVRRDRPGAVDVRLGRGGAGEAAALHARIAADTARRSAGASPAAVVIVEPAAADVDQLPHGVPVSFVFAAGSPNASIEMRIDQPAVVLPGQSASVRAEVRVSGLAGRDAVFTLEQDRVPLGEAVRAIGMNDQRFTVDLPYVPAAAGIHRVRVVAGVREGDDMRRLAEADVAVVAQARPLRVLVFEPRPSWALTFVRHAIERDPVFDLAILGRTSRGIVTRTDAAPPRLSPAALERFDAVVVGAPDALTEAEVQALEQFARVRGGAVVLQPDRLPVGPYARRLVPATFTETLLERPVALATAAGEVRASELAVAREWPPGTTSLAMRGAGEGQQPVVVSWTVGEGRLVFSGALDAWRHRADEGVAFDRFWQSLVANVAAAVPRPLELSVEPAVASPGDRLRVTARLRGGGASAAEREGLSISAALVLEDGTRRFVRLWPAAGDGVFEGRLDAPALGRHVVQATSGSWTADAALLVADGTRQSRGVDRSTLERIAGLTGGVAVDDHDLPALDAHLRDRTVAGDAVAHPMRSAWWFLAAIGALCGEWALRRRRGLR